LPIELEYRAGKGGKFGMDIGLTQGTGGRWRDWRLFSMGARVCGQVR
jgi:hypothetical protein